MPLAIGAVVGGWVGSVVAAAIGALLAAPIVVLAAVFTGGAWVVVGVLRALEWARRRVRRAQYECPEDHERFALPVYVCPACGAEHRRLVPGRWGLLRRECQCGKVALPTMVLNGRQRIPQRCPSGHPMSGMIGFAQNLRVALVGGPSAGKSTYLAGALIELEQLASTGRFAIDVFEESKSAYDGAVRALQSGVLPPKTQAANPALVAEVQGEGRSRVLYAYDVSGERYSDSDSTRELRFLEVPSGLVLLVDPLAIPQVASDLGDELERNEAALLPSAEDPMRVLERTLAALLEAGVDATKTPVAVVVAKTDAFAIGEQIDQLGGDQPVRDWLIEHGAGNFARAVEHEFKQAGWFACSALGRTPKDNDQTPYTPHGAVAPLLWVLERRGLNAAERPFTASHTQQQLATNTNFGPITPAGWRWRIGLAATSALTIIAAAITGIVITATHLTGNNTAAAHTNTPTQPPTADSSTSTAGSSGNTTTGNSGTGGDGSAASTDSSSGSSSADGSGTTTDGSGTTTDGSGTTTDGSGTTTDGSSSSGDSSSSSSDNSSGGSGTTPDGSTSAAAYSGDGYELTPPSGWIQDSTSQDHGDYTESKWHLTGHPHVVVLVDHSTGVSGSAREAGADVYAAVRKARNYSEIGTEDMQIPAGDAWVWRFTIGPEQKVDTFVVACGDSFAVLGEAPADSFDNYASTFAQVTSSLKPSCS